MTREEKRLRRQQMALAVADGQSVAQVANDFHVKVWTVRGACAEFAVVPEERGSARLLPILAAMFKPGWKMSSIALKMGCTRQRVGQIYKSACRAGIPLPERRSA